MSKSNSKLVFILCAILVLFLVICAVSKEGKQFVERLTDDKNDNGMFYSVKNLIPSGVPWNSGNPAVWKLNQEWKLKVPTLKQYLK
jgi:hypothetical protein